MKTCCRCKRLLELNAFGTCRRERDGKNYACKECVRAVNSPEYRARNRARLVAAQKKYRTRNAEKVRAANRAYYVRTRPARLEYSRTVQRNKKDYYAFRNAENRRLRPDQYRAIARNWAHSSSGRICIRVKNHNRRERVRGAGDGLTAAQLTRLLAAFDGVCAWCSNAAGATLDHVVSLKRGGAHAVGNIVPSCKRCNSKKSARDPHVWAAMVGADLEAVLAKARGAA